MKSSGFVLILLVTSLWAASAEAKTCISHYAMAAKLLKLDQGPAKFIVREKDMKAIHEVSFNPLEVRNRMDEVYPGFLAVSQYCDLVGESGPGLPYRVGNDPHLHPDFWKMQMGGMSALPAVPPAKPVGLKAKAIAISSPKSSKSDRWESAGSDKSATLSSEAVRAARNPVTGVVIAPPPTQNPSFTGAPTADTLPTFESPPLHLPDVSGPLILPGGPTQGDVQQR